jgi:glycosyltransferase involved in cell wall biosynthesis
LNELILVARSQMKIAMTTIPFLPQVGGMETVASLLARELTKLGCEVKVATMTASEQKDSFPYEVVRQPSRLELWRLYRWADVYLQHGPSLKFGWPVFFGRKPAVIVHHIWMAESSGIPLFGKWLRLSFLKRCRNLAVSSALGKSLPVPWQVVPNPYDDESFRLLPEIPRHRDLVFLGRLESAKGAGDLIDALGILKARSCEPTVTIIGSGSIKDELELKVRELGLAKSVNFAGAKQGNELAKILNGHRIMVLPSRWLEPFGIVALEGIACGCAVIGSSGGGLPEAIGPCGAIFPNGDVVTLAEKIETLLNSPDLLADYQQKFVGHLSQHGRHAVSKKYLAIFGNQNPCDEHPPNLI